MDHLLRVTCREMRELCVLQIAPNNVLDRKSVAQSKCGLERLLWIWETMTCKVHPVVLAELFNDPRFLSIYVRECGEAVDALTETSSPPNHFGLADGDESLLLSCRTQRIAPSSTNGGTQSWGMKCRYQGSSTDPSYRDLQRARAAQRTRR